MTVRDLINHAGKAGTERYVRTLIEGAGRYGHRPFFAYNESGPLQEQAEELGVECVRIEMRGPFDLAAAKRLARLCRERAIDVVHTNYLRENYIAILAKRLFLRRLKVIYTNHFVIGNTLPMRAANRLMTPGDHRIISVCRVGAEQLIANGNAKNKIIVIHNAVAPEVWSPGPDYARIRARTRGLYALGANETVFLCASRFADDKGHRYFIDAVARLAAVNGADRLKVLLAGDGPLLGEIRERAVAAGLLDRVIRFVGFVRDMKSLFYASDVYVNPSRHEASSFLILEALASGLPVIATDMGGNREIVNDENGCGILVTYDDAEMLRCAMQSLRENPALREEKKAKALLTIRQKFALDDMLARTFAVYL
ncbi:MAG: glycosyltransferase [Clostridiales bacterium]|jgi:glycosyltransferase involved in cell wall biosynthesis|nr:glycosyltransferase [Clostridiales bacterium]